MEVLPRTTFSVSVTLLALLILTGFRAWLYFQRRSELRELTVGERLRLFWVGLRLDSVIVSRVWAPLVFILLLLPDTMIVASRPFLLVYAGIVSIVFFIAEIAGLY